MECTADRTSGPDSTDLHAQYNERHGRTSCRYRTMLCCCLLRLSRSQRARAHGEHGCADKAAVAVCAQLQRLCGRVAAAECVECAAHTHGGAAAAGTAKHLTDSGKMNPREDRVIMERTANTLEKYKYDWSIPRACLWVIPCSLPDAPHCALRERQIRQTQLYISTTKATTAYPSTTVTAVPSGATLCRLGTRALKNSASSTPFAVSDTSTPQHSSHSRCRDRSPPHSRFLLPRCCCAAVAAASVSACASVAISASIAAVTGSPSCAPKAAAAGGGRMAVDGDVSPDGRCGGGTTPATLSVRCAASTRGAAKTR